MILDEEAVLKMCKSKKRYDTEIQAERFMKAVIWANHAEDPNMAVYCCPICKGYHFGHPKRHRVKATCSSTIPD